MVQGNSVDAMGKYPAGSASVAAYALPVFKAPASVSTLQTVTTSADVSAASSAPSQVVSVTTSVDPSALSPPAAGQTAGPGNLSGKLKSLFRRAGSSSSNGTSSDDSGSNGFNNSNSGLGSNSTKSNNSNGVATSTVTVTASSASPSSVSSSVQQSATSTTTVTASATSADASSTSFEDSKSGDGDSSDPDKSSLAGPVSTSTVYVPASSSIAESSTNSSSTAISSTSSTIVSSVTVTSTSSLASATPVSSELSCPQHNGTVYTANDGAQYMIECYVDRASHDLYTIEDRTLESCINSCEGVSECDDVSWVYPDGPCYLKSGLGAPSEVIHIWGARHMNGSSSTSSSTPTMYANTTSSSSVAPSTSMVVSTSSAPAASPSVSHPSCPSDDGKVYGTSAYNKEFRIQCYKDYTDDGVQMPTIKDFGACLTACGNSTTCQAVSFVHEDVNKEAWQGGCWLKDSADGMIDEPSNLVVWAARREVAVPLTTASPSSTSMTSTSRAVVNQTVTYSSSSSVAVVTRTVASSSMAGSVAIVTSTIARSSRTMANATKTSITRSTRPASTATGIAYPVGKPWNPCGSLNRNGNTFYLRTHLIHGHSEFENLYVQRSDYGIPSMVPVMGRNRTNAGHAYYDHSTSSVAFWYGECKLMGLAMDKDSDMNAWSPVWITDTVGTARMSVANGELVWNDDRFGSWLVCKHSGKYELLYWDVITNQGIDTDTCAKVQLITENS